MTWQDLLRGDIGEPVSPAEFARMDSKYRRIMGHDVAAEMDRQMDEGIERNIAEINKRNIAEINKRNIAEINKRNIAEINKRNIAEMGSHDAHERQLKALIRAWLYPYRELC